MSCCGVDLGAGSVGDGDEEGVDGGGVAGVEEEMADGSVGGLTEGVVGDVGEAGEIGGVDADAWDSVGRVAVGEVEEGEEDSGEEVVVGEVEGTAVVEEEVAGGVYLLTASLSVLRISAALFLSKPISSNV